MTVSPDWDGSGADYVSYSLALMEVAAKMLELFSSDVVEERPLTLTLSPGRGD